MIHKLLLALTTLGLVGSVNAATVSSAGQSDNGTWASLGLDFETLTAGSDDGARGISQSRGEFYQTFSLDSTLKVENIFFDARAIASNVDFQIRFFEVDDVDTGTIGTVVLAPITINTGTWVTTGGNSNQEILQISLAPAEQVTLTASQAYGFALQTVTTGATAFNVNWDTANTYAGGRFFGNGASTSTDLILGFTAVPEPSALALLGVVGGCLFMRRRRS